ncbi:MAG TPA: hypothetical protein VLJ61_07820 [Pyrinomonadaceae bacterium]|nr:hypothetical protein [Pyrinomonadaceae bacterium]
MRSATEIAPVRSVASASATQRASDAATDARAGSASLASSGAAFAFACACVVAASATLAGFAPLGLSVATVFLFAGPHNWVELRYFIARMPARLGRSRNFFALAAAGVVTLTASYGVLALYANSSIWGGEELYAGVAVWNSLFVAWVAALVWMRGRLSRREWAWALPAGSALIALNWLAPQLLSLSLVYLHPLVALWFLDRQLKRTRSEWRRAYHSALALLPLALGILWWRLASAPSIPGDDAVTLRIVRHAGADVLPVVSTHLLVSTHVFLETLHYAVWLVAMPLVAGAFGAPWRLGSIPLVRHREGWPRLIRALLFAGAFAVVALWLCFLKDYATTRDVYFTLATAHVLAEVPFLLRMV